MAKFVGQNVHLYFSLYFAISIVAKMDSYTSDIPTIEEFGYEPSPTPEEIETLYDKSKPPPDPKLLLEVWIINVNFEEAQSQMMCNVTLHINIQWKDIRLPKALKYLGIPQKSKIYNESVDQSQIEYISDHAEKIWTPILTFKSNSILKLMRFSNNNKDEAVFLGIHPKEKAGLVSISTVWHGVARSENDFEYFPEDNHICRFTFSLVPTGGAVFLSSSNVYNSSYNDTKKDPVFSRKRALAKHHGRYLEMDILFTRKIGYHLIQTFIPSGLLTGISLMSLFLPVEIAEARVSLCVGILIAITVFANEARKAGPVVSYITAMDVWLLGCISIEILILIENIVILKITTRRVIPRSFPVMSAITKIMREGYSVRQSDTQEVVLPRGNEEQEQRNIRIGILLASRIDYICIIISTGLVLAFNIVYWLTLHFHENEMINDLNSN